MTSIELLAPARDLACGLTAIECGADAIYIGAERFGARAKAGNPLEDIEALTRYAHAYWAKVYVTVNTLLHDLDLPQAVRLLHQLHEIGVDGAIVQDVGLLECDLPPLPLIASTQMHNHTLARVAFLEQVGFQRAILARELSLEQIRAIRQATTTIELESFVHGALCVCYSGQCYLSYAVGGRSGNRGECAQPCRRHYSLVDADGKVLVHDRHLLSLRDLNLSDHLAELIDAGVTCFKIEGRLKDETYVANVVSAYRCQLDAVLEAKGLRKSSSGHSTIDFCPDLDKTFNRGYTTYFLHGRGEPPGSIDTPKMRGEFVGQVVALKGKSLTLDTDVELHSGDGICFFDTEQELQGTVVNAAHTCTNVHACTVTPQEIEGIRKGTRIYRNHDHAFLKRLRKGCAERKIAVRLKLEETHTGFILTAADEDSNVAAEEMADEKAPAEKPEKVLSTIEKQLRKMGDTEFACAELEIAWEKPYFLPVSALNQLRRETLEKLTTVRARNRPVLRATIRQNNVSYPERTLSYLGNVLNQKAAAFYRRHGVEEIAPAAESGLDMRGKRVMLTRYCVKHQLGLCPREKDAPPLKEPLYLVDEDGHKYRLRFNCATCEMEVFF
ncbi:MAG: U32 family peptidase [Anaerolineae bacterium]|nr:U32 family peptidase [Anaerolineae bacterium]